MPKFFDEMRDSSGAVRSHYAPFTNWLENIPGERLKRKRAEPDLTFHRMGITFAVYGEESGKERLIPFDIVPRIIAAKEWEALQRGLKQRVRALNMFLHDIYHEQKILKSGVVPSEEVLGNAQYRKEMQGVDVAAEI